MPPDAVEVSSKNNTPPTSRIVYLGVELTRRMLKDKRLGLIFLALLLVATFIFESSPASGLILCPLRRLTGIECAGCGMTRSWVSLTEGNLSIAVALNPFGPILFGLAVVKIIALSIEVSTKRVLVIPIWEKLRNPLLGTVAVAMITFGFYRLYLFFAP